jgi:ribose 5-phosphate isomerase B
MKKVLIASDHAGFAGKENIKKILDRMGIGYLDLGPGSETSVDYPDFAELVATGIANGDAERGILVCGSGIGMQIAANKVPGVRAALAWNEETARLCRQHNDANVLAVGSRTTPAETIEKIVHAFLTTEFDGGRHQQRLDKISRLEEKQGNTSQSTRSN